MISCELPEVLGMADRVVVLFEGRVMREFAGAEADEDAIMRAATGIVEEAVMTTLAEEQKVARQRASSHQVAELLFRFRELGIVLALVIVVGATTIDNHLFLSAHERPAAAPRAPRSLPCSRSARRSSLVTRNVDLSIGSVLGHLRVRSRRALPGITHMSRSWSSSC